MKILMMSFSRISRLVAVVCVAGLLMSGGEREAAAQNQGVCDRTEQVHKAIVAASGAPDCAQVTLRHLREITSLDLRQQGIGVLSVGDFDGLVRLQTLDLSNNRLAALPHGVFDELYLLKVLRLDSNQLRGLDVDVFDELFLLEELTLSSNSLTSLPNGMFDDFSRFDGMQANGALPDNSGQYPRIQRYLDRHDVTSAEEFITALPDLHKERFVMMYESGAPVHEFVSGDYPRVISFGADGRFTFSWATDPAAEAPFRESVEFLRQDEFDWAAGMIDFSGTVPAISEPASCATCHGSLNKPLWGEWGKWPGSENAKSDDSEVQASLTAYMDTHWDSTDPRIAPLDFSGSDVLFAGWTRFHVTPGRGEYVTAVEDAGAVWSWSHAEVLFNRLRAYQQDFRQWSEDLVCAGPDWIPRYKPTVWAFEQVDHNLFLSGDSDLEIRRGGFIAGPYGLISDVSGLVRYSYYFHSAGSVADAVVFLVLVDLWESEPIVRRLYRNTPNQETVVTSVSDVFKIAMLHYASGTATAEDELIQKLRIHFGHGGWAALDARASQNEQASVGSGVQSASFWDGHGQVMRERVCDALTTTKPENLSVTLTDGDAVLSWDAPDDDDDLAGYRILRGKDGETPTTHVEDTGSTATSWTDESVPSGDYVYAVQSLFDGYPSPESNRVTVAVTAESAAPEVSGPTAFTVVEGTTAVGTLSATDTDTAAADLVWSLSGGADSSHFTLSTGGTLAFAAAKDYETPDDAGSDGTYNVTVQVSDGVNNITADVSVALSNLNEAPTADAGADQSDVEAGASVTLSGSGADSDAGDTLQYAWTQTGGTTVTLSAPAAAITTFAAPTGLTENAVLTFTLRVTDAGGLFEEDEVTVTVAAEPAAPEVSGPTAFTVVEGATAVGTLSATDTDTAAADLVWSLSGGADSSHFTLSAGGTLAFAAAKDYEAPDDAGSDGTYNVTVQVSDGVNNITADVSVALSNLNEAPTADAGADQSDVEAGASVTLSGSGADSDAGDTLQYAWTQTGGTTVTLSAPAAAITTFAAPTGLTENAVLTFTLRVTDAAGLFEEDEVSVTVVAVAAAEALTASFHSMPEEHDGKTPFTFELRFSEEVSISFKTLRDSAFNVTNGQVTGARRLNRPSNLRWEIAVEPTSAEDLTIALPGGRACDASGAVCTSDGRPLSENVETTVAPALTAEFTKAPEQHDASSTFRVRLLFSAPVTVSPETMRDEAVTVTGGTLSSVVRVRGRRDLWSVRVTPSGVGAVSVSLAATTSCDVSGAVCTSDGRALSAAVSVRIPGPAQ